MEQLKTWINTYPRLFAWIILAVGMDIILLFSARDVGLEGRQWFWLLLITTLVAGACVWIISWGDDDEAEEDDAAANNQP